MSQVQYRLIEPETLRRDKELREAAKIIKRSPPPHGPLR